MRSVLHSNGQHRCLLKRTCRWFHGHVNWQWWHFASHKPVALCWLKNLCLRFLLRIAPLPTRRRKGPVQATLSNPLRDSVRVTRVQLAQRKAQKPRRNTGVCPLRTKGNSSAAVSLRISSAATLPMHRYRGSANLYRHFHRALQVSQLISLVFG